MTITPQRAAWRPMLAGDAEPLHVRLLSALQQDLASGVLAPGARLPTHRELAHQLNIGVSTVTRAYVEAEAQGLIISQVGRGSFVAQERPAAARPLSDPLDLARNLAPSAPAAKRLREAMRLLRRRPDLIEHLAYAPPAGLPAHRRAGAAWLERTAGLERADWTRLLVCAGAQQALALTFALLCRPGDTILTEAGTFFGVCNLAEHAGYRLRGVAMDAEGLLPEALDRAAEASGARVLYTLPTLQNPTGRTLSRERREAITRIARARDFWIVEDDVYAAFAADAPPALAMLAPERTFYVSGVSKVLGAGLRTGYLLAPTGEQFDRLTRAVRATVYSPPTFGALIATQWIEDGAADLIAREVRDEVDARREIASTVLGETLEMGAGGAPHVWLPLSELDAERLARRALRNGVEVTPPSAPIVEPSSLSGLRLSLGGVENRGDLERALRVIAAAMRERSGADARGVV